MLKNIDLQIPAGTVCGIVGATGAGKSTLVNLLLRLYEPEDQTVFIDGIDIKQMARRHLEEAVGYVSQEIFLFFGSVRDNILFGAMNGEAERVEEATRIAQLLPTIQLFGAGFDTVIGERGVRLSGGQKQRTALARAIIKNPPILILDDAFSSVDAETEDEILRELNTVHARAHDALDLASDIDGARRGSDRLLERRRDYRAGDARRAR